MKNTKIEINTTKFENGDVLVISSNRIHFVKTSDDVMEYNNNEMLEVYGVDFS